MQELNESDKNKFKTAERKYSTYIIMHLRNSLPQEVVGSHSISGLKKVSDKFMNKRPI